MMRFTLPRDMYYGKGALEDLKNLSGKKAIVVSGGSSMRTVSYTHLTPKPVRQQITLWHRRIHARASLTASSGTGPRGTFTTWAARASAAGRSRSFSNRIPVTKGTFSLWSFRRRRPWLPMW